VFLPLLLLLLLLPMLYRFFNKRSFIFYPVLN
jgi:hypothetical protein